MDQVAGSERVPFRVSEECKLALGRMGLHGHEDTITLQQAKWLAEMSLQRLGKHATEVYAILSLAGCEHLISKESRAKVLVDTFDRSEEHGDPEEV